jgi:hypothetical protein
VKCYNGIDLSVCLRIPYNLCAINLYQQWVSPVQVVPKKEGMSVVKNVKNELIPQSVTSRPKA